MWGMCQEDFQTQSSLWSTTENHGHNTGALPKIHALPGSSMKVVVLRRIFSPHNIGSVPFHMVELWNQLFSSWKKESSISCPARACCVPSDVCSPLPSLLLKKVSHKNLKVWTLVIAAFQSPETWIAVRQWHIHSYLNHGVWRTWVYV